MEIFNLETLIKGKPAQVACVEIGGQTFTVTKGPLNVVQLQDEWYEDVRDPEFVIDILATPRFQARIFTFWQRCRILQVQYRYYMEWESIAALPVQVTTIGSTTRSLRASEARFVRRRRKELECAKPLTMTIVGGMTAIFNETPVRQGKKFWHYGKDFETVKHQFSRYILREE